MRFTSGESHPKFHHGLSRTPEYVAWTNMRHRCSSPKARNFDYYGGRGIRVCDRWRDSFEAFLADMGPRPTPAHTIERENTDGHYEPGNCTWATKKVQQRNRRDNVLTVDLVQQARALKRSGAGPKAIAEALHLPISAIRSAVYGSRAWQ